MPIKKIVPKNNITTPKKGHIAIKDKKVINPLKLKAITRLNKNILGKVGDNFCKIALNDPYQNKLLINKATTFNCETNGTWTMAYYDKYILPDLVYIKTQNTQTGKVEVHIASGRSGYQDRILEIPTTFNCESNGTWLMAYYDNDDIPDLVYIKTQNTQTGKVEVHIASGSSNYQQRILEIPTTFNCESNGTWLMTYYDDDDIPDLVYIKTQYAQSGKVEVHIASGCSNYQTRILEVPTTFGYEYGGTWLMDFYDDDGIPDLVFIKTNYPETLSVEVHVASGNSKYLNRILETGTNIYNGMDIFYGVALPSEWVWLMTYYDDDYIPDLVFIQTTGTTSGKVEVSINGSN